MKNKFSVSSPSSQTRFAVGDRVVAYAPSRLIGSVSALLTDGLMKVDMDKHSFELVVHPKQCRRLIKKPKPARRSIWIGPITNKELLRKGESEINYIRSTPYPGADGWVEFVEKRPKKKGRSNV